MKSTNNMKNLPNQQSWHQKGNGPGTHNDKPSGTGLVASLHQAVAGSSITSNQGPSTDGLSSAVGTIAGASHKVRMKVATPKQQIAAHQVVNGVGAVVGGASASNSGSMGNHGMQGQRLITAVASTDMKAIGSAQELA